VITASIKLATRWSGHSRFGWLTTLVITFIGAVLRFANLANPKVLVFDETYYVKDAYTLGLFGSERKWPENANAAFEAGDISGFLDSAAYVVHPPFGKWVIWLGMQPFGAESPFGWRFATALLGTLMIPLVIVIARKLIGSNFFAAVAGLLMALEGLSITLSRTAILDGILAFFVVLGFYFTILDGEQWRQRLRSTRSSSLMLRPWLLAAGLTLGLAISVKWSGLYFLAAFGLYTLVIDIWLRGKFGMPRILAIGQGFLNALTLLLPALIAYLVSWLGWILGSDGWGRNSEGNWLESLWAYHLNAFGFHTGLASDHPYQANAFQWLISLRPTAFFFERYEDGENCGLLENCTVALTAIPNLVIWFGGLLAVIWILGRNIRQLEPRSFAIAVGFLAGWLPWVFFLERTTFQFYAVVYAPFLVLALTFGIHHYWRTGIARKATNRSGVIAVLLFSTAVFATYFLSIWLALPVPDFIWRMQMLMPFWI